MKIKVKKVVTTERVEDIQVGFITVQGDINFNQVIEELRHLTFVATSCSHNEFDSFISYEQGGSNSHDLTYIQLVDDSMYKYTFLVKWDDRDSAYIIFRK